MHHGDPSLRRHRCRVLSVTIPSTTIFTPPPTPPPTPTSSTARPLPNCAVGDQATWDGYKKGYCCRVHHVGCPSTMPITTFRPIIPTFPPTHGPVDPYNCADGWSNWQAGWSVGKKEWCCRVHGKGCPGQD